MNAPVLPPIPWQRIPITPLPDVFEDDTPTGWALWDAAVKAQEQKREEGGK